MPPKPSKRLTRQSSRKSRETATQESVTSLANLPPELKSKISSMVSPSKRIASIFYVEMVDPEDNTTKSGYQLWPAPNILFDGSRGIAHSVIGSRNAGRAHRRTPHTMNTIQNIIRNNLSLLFTNIRQIKGSERRKSEWKERINLYANKKKIPPRQIINFLQYAGPVARKPFADYSHPLNCFEKTPPSKNFSYLNRLKTSGIYRK